MTEKLKIKDLEDDPNLPDPLTDKVGQVNSKLAIDELAEEDVKDVATSKVEVKKVIAKEAVVVKEKVKEVIEPPVYFQRNFLIAYSSKAISTAVVLAALDLLSHVLKFLDGVDIRDKQNFESLMLAGNNNVLICKILAFLIFVYILTNKTEIAVSKKGIIAFNSELTDKIFFTNKKVFLSWGQIKVVKLKMRIFEPYLYFYDEKNEALGYLEFSIASREKFYSYVSEQAGAQHPIMKTKAEGMLF